MLHSSKHRYGWKRQTPDHRDLKYTVPPAVARTLPPSVNFDDPPLPAPFNPSHDQGALGSCGPNALGLITIFEMLDELGAEKFMPSRLFLYYNTRAVMGTIGYDSGVDNRSMMQALKKYGWCPEELWPYAINRFTTRPQEVCFSDAAKRIDLLRYEAVPQELATMKGAIADRKAILFGFTVYESFESSETERTGDVQMPQRGEGVYGGHDVVLIGYDDATARFRFKNSWGSGWGKNGTGTFPYAFCTNRDYADDFWTITSITGENPLPVPPPGPPIPPVPPAPPLDIAEVHRNIDLILNAVRKSYPWFLGWAIDDAHERIHRYFDSLTSTRQVWPPEIIAVIDQIFDALILTAKNPIVKWILVFAKGLVDAYLSNLK